MNLMNKCATIKFSSLSAPTKIEELTAGSDEKKHSAAPPGIEPKVLRILVARSNHYKCATFHKVSPSGKKVKFNLARAIELSETAVFVYNFV